MAMDGEPAGRSMWGWLPVIWLCLVMALSARGIDASFTVLQEFALPDEALYLIYASVAAGAVTILWGLYLVGLAYTRSQRFPRHFTLWQAAIIVFLAAKEIYVLAAPTFVFTPIGLAITVGEIAVGLFMIALVNRRGPATALVSNDGRGRPPLLVSAIAAVLGIVLGGAIGFGAGLAAGVGISEATDMSCFEGACGFFAVFVGLAGAVIGMIAGGIFAVWRVNRRRQSAAG